MKKKNWKNFQNYSSIGKIYNLLYINFINFFKKTYKKFFFRINKKSEKKKLKNL